MVTSTNPFLYRCLICCTSPYPNNSNSWKSFFVYRSHLKKKKTVLKLKNASVYTKVNLKKIDTYIPIVEKLKWKLPIESRYISSKNRMPLVHYLVLSNSTYLYFILKWCVTRNEKINKKINKLVAFLKNKTLKSLLI